MIAFEFSTNNIKQTKFKADFLYPKQIDILYPNIISKKEIHN
jgi:hypothetical protein